MRAKKNKECALRCWKITGDELTIRFMRAEIEKSEPGLLTKKINNAEFGSNKEDKMSLLYVRNEGLD